MVLFCCTTSKLLELISSSLDYYNLFYLAGNKEAAGVINPSTPVSRLFLLLLLIFFDNVHFTPAVTFRSNMSCVVFQVDPKRWSAKGNQSSSPQKVTAFPPGPLPATVPSPSISTVPTQPAVAVATTPPSKSNTPQHGSGSSKSRSCKFLARCQVGDAGIEHYILLVFFLNVFQLQKNLLAVV